MRPQMVIITDNTLSAMALRTLLVDIAKGIEVVCYNSLDEFVATAEDVVAHFFVSAETVFRNPDYFRAIMRRTIVITEGEAPAFVQSGFSTIDATTSEQEIVRSILQFHHAGHPGGYPMHHIKQSVEPTITLSTREREVLALVVKGYINKEIADMLNISLATVIFHRNNISEKLHTRSIGRLTIYAVLNNIVPLSEL